MKLKLPFPTTTASAASGEMPAPSLMDRLTQPDSPKKEHGASAAEVMLWAGVSALVLGGVGALGLTVYGNVLGNQARTELNTLLAVGQRYRQTNRSYTDVSISQLVDNGYGMDQYTDGVGENAYGLNITIAATGANDVDATVTYGTDTEESCDGLVEEVSKDRRVTLGTTPCASGDPSTLTLTLN